MKHPSEQLEGPCDVCRTDPYDCTCPECPICGAGDPKCTHLNHPIKVVVMPLIAAAQDRARQEAQRVIDKFKAELEKAGMDAHQVAPYPSGHDRRGEYQRKEWRYTLLRSITKPKDGNGHRRHGAELRAMNEKGCNAFIAESIRAAREQYLGFVIKLIAKIGEGVTSATLEGDHVWSSSILTVMKGEVRERWRTTQIVNMSKHGKLFNQWPTRKLKENS